MKKILIIICFLSVTNYSPSMASENTVTIMILGDSLSTGYGIPIKTGWVNLLKQRLQTRTPINQVINISIDGETTLGGRNRIEQALQKHHPNIILIGLGGNDGLQGLSIKTIHENLEAIVKASKKNDTAILLLGMQIPPNYGTSYTQKFRDIYLQLANKYRLELVPFLLAGFGEDRHFFQSDGIHPNSHAQKIILDNIWPVFYPMLQSSITEPTNDE